MTTLCAARLGSAIFSRRSYSSRASPGTLLARRINSPISGKIPSRSIKMRIAGFGWRVGLAGYQAVEFLAIEDQLKINKKVKPAPWF